MARGNRNTHKKAKRLYKTLKQKGGQHGKPRKKKKMVQNVKRRHSHVKYQTIIDEYTQETIIATKDRLFNKIKKRGSIYG